MYLNPSITSIVTSIAAKIIINKFWVGDFVNKEIMMK